jgi:hypothetical protein
MRYSSDNDYDRLCRALNEAVQLAIWMGAKPDRVKFILADHQGRESPEFLPSGSLND